MQRPKSAVFRPDYEKIILHLFHLGLALNADNLKNIHNNISHELFQKIILMHHNKPDNSSMHIEYSFVCVRTLLASACKFGYISIAEIMIDKFEGPRTGELPLFMQFACEHNQFPICDILIRAGVTHCPNKECPGHGGILFVS
jgi:hypothetical protein